MVYTYELPCCFYSKHRFLKWDIIDLVANFQKQAQEYYSKAPVIVLGSGASMAFGLPGMQNLADYLIENINNLSLESFQQDEWVRLCKFLLNGRDLEFALQNVNLNEEMTNLVARGTWDLICKSDEEVYKKSFLERTFFPLGTLLDHMFKTSISQLDIVTTNYDCLAEYACDQQSIYYFNGFTTGFTKKPTDENQLKAKRTVNIWKVHGSLDWFYSAGFQTIGISKFNCIPDGFQPQIITPGMAKYQKTHMEPFRTIISKADTALQNANSYFCFGFGFNDEHIQPKLVSKCETDNACITVATYSLTEHAKKLLFSGKIHNFLAIERGENNNQSIIYTSLQSERIIVEEDYWSMSGFLNLIL